MNFIFVSPNFPEIYSHFVKELHDKGVNVLGIGDQPYMNLNEELKANLTEYCYVSDMNNMDWMRNTIGYLQSKYGHIDFIESNNEYWMRKDAQYRKEFGIDTGYMPEDLDLYQSKSGMKQFFNKAGVKTARYILVSTVEESLKFVSEVGYPVFAKPDSGVGASDTFKINNEEELRNFHNIEKHEKYIMEEFLEGYIVSFDGIANREADVTICFKETFPTPIAEVVTKNEDVYYYAISKIDPEYKEMGKRIVKAFNISKRCFHIELFMLTKDKKGLANKGEIVALEANLRSPGGETPTLLNLVSKVDYFKTYAEMMTTNVSGIDNSTDYVAVSANIKWELHYKHNHDEIMNKYKDNIVKYGDYPESFRNALGDRYYIARFNNLESMKEFVEFVQAKI